MKSESLEQNFISAVSFRAGNLHDGKVVGDTRENFYQCEDAPAKFAPNSETDIVDPSIISRKQLYSRGDLAKRRYEDMTPSRIEGVDGGNDHDEISLKLGHFREQMKRRPPEARNLIQVQGSCTTVRVEEGALEEDEIQARRSGNTRRSCSASGVEVTPEICGESDLTAENHMAEDSSRSSNNDGASMFESAAESVSKGSTKELRTVSSSGVMHCFMVDTNGGRDINVNRTDMKEVKDRGVPKSEPVASNQLRSRSTAAGLSSVNTLPSQLWRRSSEEWLQLGVGNSGIKSNAQSELVSGEEGKPFSVGQGYQERALFQRKVTSTPMDFPIAADREANSNTFSETSNINAVRTSDWQFRSGPNVLPPKGEASSDPGPVNLNPAIFRSVPISGLMTSGMTSAVVPETTDVEKPDLCIFGRRLIQTGTARQELVLAPLNGSRTRKSSSNASDTDRAMAATDSSFQIRRDEEDLLVGMFPAGFSGRNEQFGNAALRRSEIQNRIGPPFSSMSTTITGPIRDGHFSAAGTSMDQSNSSQCQRDNYPPSSLSALQQRREDLRHGQVGYPWLPPPAAELAPKLVPMANNFQGWTSSELTSTTKSATMSASTAEYPLDQQAMRASDEWGNLFRKVSPKMLFQSPYHLPEGSSALVPGLLQSAGQGGNVGSQENLVALKRAIENIKSPEWPIPPEATNVSVGSWCLNGNLQGVRGDSKQLHCFAGEQSQFMSSALPQSGPVHYRFGGDHLNTSEMPPSRHSWQPAAGNLKFHHGNVNALQRPSPEAAGKQKFTVLPSAGSKATNHAGLWFVLQSAENQNNEAGLPQVSKAYLHIMDGNMPVSTVKKYLVTKLGLANESEVEITCKGQPVVPSLPLQHVRDAIWFSSLNSNVNGSDKEHTSSGERDERGDEPTTSASEQRSRPAPGTDRHSSSAGIFSKDILMVLTYRRHPGVLQGSTLLT